MPQDPAVLQKEIPGIGPYTSAAITSIAFNTPIAAVDGNVQRVYSRVFGIYANPSAKATSSHLQDLADQIMPEDRPGDYNQALMDLGFSVCTPKNPSCASCPLAAQCVAYAQVCLIYYIRQQSAQDYLLMVNWASGTSGSRCEARHWRYRSCRLWQMHFMCAPPDYNGRCYTIPYA